MLGDVVRYANALSYQSGWPKKVRHEYAITEKLSGPSTLYETHVHAALKDGTDPLDTLVFGLHTHSCATVDRTNSKAQTCTSPWYNTSSGSKWTVYSGHHYDINGDGNDDTCLGCIDWVYDVP